MCKYNENKVSIRCENFKDILSWNFKLKFKVCNLTFENYVTGTFIPVFKLIETLSEYFFYKTKIKRENRHKKLYTLFNQN